MNATSLIVSFPRRYITLIKQTQKHPKGNSAVVQVDRLIFRDLLSAPVPLLIGVFVTGLALAPLLTSALAFALESVPHLHLRNYQPNPIKIISRIGETTIAQPHYDKICPISSKWLLNRIC